MVQHRKTKRTQNKVSTLIALKHLKRNKRKGMLTKLIKKVGA